MFTDLRENFDPADDANTRDLLIFETALRCVLKIKGQIL